MDASTGFDTRSLLCAPLKHRDQTAGVIQIISEREGAFSDDDLSLLFAMAFISAAALEKTRLYAAAQSRVRELTLLNEIGLTVNSTLDRTQVIQAALSLVQHLFPADGILLLQPDLRTGELNFVQALTRTGSIEVSFSLSPGEGIAGWAMEHRQATLVKNAQDDPRFSDRLDRFLGTRTRALMAAPLLVPEGVSGVLEVISWQMSLYTSDDLRALQSVASTLAVALENARLYAEQTRLLQEREQAQEQLIHSEKMSALGRLASSIAHEINNPLQAIQGCMTLASEELEGQQRPEKLKRYFGIVSSEIERIANLGRRMRDFYRPARAGRTLTDVHDVLASVLELSNKQLEQSDIAIERHWAAELPMVYANPDHLQQVFLNLFINAIDAMPRGGTLSIATSMDWLPGNGHQFNSPHIPPVRAVRIDLSDTGVGMSLETQSRLFEPFFTSKEYGSGLGLSISYGIIQSHRGQIKVESKEGIGTTFTILLPTAETLQASEERP